MLGSKQMLKTTGSGEFLNTETYWAYFCPVFVKRGGLTTYWQRSDLCTNENMKKGKYYRTAIKGSFFNSDKHNPFAC